MSSATLELAQQMIRLRSVTPEDAGCQNLIARRLKPLGFVLESMRCGEVTNLWVRRGQAKPLECFAGHTDVVPTGPLDQWVSDPFEPSVREGIHKLNEHIELDDLDALKSIYRQVLERLLLPA